MKRDALTRCSLIALLLIAAIVPGAQGQRDRLPALERELGAYCEDGGVPGMAIALADKNGVVWSRGFGYADREKQRKATPDTPFMLASVSKTFIAMAISIARDAGQLDLDTDIHEYLEFTIDNPRINDETITLRHLASHTSSLRDGPAVDDSYRDGDPSVDMGPWLAQYFTPGGEHYHAKGNFYRDPPGTTHIYSNVGAALAAHVVARQVGTPYNQFCRERIFEPLGMQNTGFMIADFGPDEIAVPYEAEDDDFRALEQYGFPTYPDGQLRSSVNDMGRYAATLINGGKAPNGNTLLSPASTNAMFDVLFEGSDEGKDQQALFWYVRTDGTVGHSGGDDGVSTDLFIDRDAGMAGIILINASGSREVAETLMRSRAALLDTIRNWTD